MRRDPACDSSLEPRTVMRGDTQFQGGIKLALGIRNLLWKALLCPYLAVALLFRNSTLAEKNDQEARNHGKCPLIKHYYQLSFSR